MLWIRKYLLVNSDGWPNERKSLVGAVQLGTKGELGSLQPDCLPLLYLVVIDILGVPYIKSNISRHANSHIRGVSKQNIDRNIGICKIKMVTRRNFLNQANFKLRRLDY